MRRVLYIYILLLFSMIAKSEDKTVIYRDLFLNPTNWSTTDGAEFKQEKPYHTLYLQLNQGKGVNTEKLLARQDVFGNAATSEKKSVSIECDLTEKLEKYSGCEIEVAVDIKAQNVTGELKPWEGVRTVLNFQTRTTSFGSSAYHLHGTFDWKTITFRTRIPERIEKITLLLGIVAENGSARIRNLRISQTDISRKERRKNWNPEKLYKGHSLPRLRGLNNYVEAKVEEITCGWKANVTKYSFPMPPPSVTQDALDGYLKPILDKIDKAVDKLRPSGAYLVIQLHNTAFTRQNGNDLYYTRPEYAELFARTWKRVAEHYKKEHDVIWGFELMNESAMRSIPAPGCPDYEELMEMAAKEINRTDPKRTIIVQPEEWWGMNAFYKLRPIKAKNIVYAVHFYAPFKITHQNLWKTGTPLPYPGMCQGVYWNRNTLRQEMESARDFQKAYNVHMFVSEFSCIRWAPGAAQWLEDAISLFEEYGWDWMYHDIYGFNGWSPELGSDRNNLKRITGNPRESILKKWMNRNQFRKEAKK